MSVVIGHLLALMRWISRLVRRGWALDPDGSEREFDCRAGAPVADHVRREAIDLPAHHRRRVVLLAVLLVPLAARMRPVGPGAALALDCDHRVGEGEVELPLP